MSDNNVRAMAAGKQAVSARTVWQLEVGPVRLRCLREEDHSGYVVQLRDPKSGWKVGAFGPDPLELLQKAAAYSGVRSALAESNRA